MKNRADNSEEQNILNKTICPSTQSLPYGYIIEERFEVIRKGKPFMTTWVSHNKKFYKEKDAVQEDFELFKKKYKSTEFRITPLYQNSDKELAEELKEAKEQIAHLKTEIETKTNNE